MAKRILGSLALGLAAAVAGATVAMAADAGSLNVTRDGNSTSGGKYNFKYTQTSSGAWKTRVWGSFVVTEPTARVDAHVDGYAWGNAARRTTKGTSSYDKTMYGDTKYADSVSLRVCYEGVLWFDCTSKQVNR